MTGLFSVDREGDRLSASDGVSRYGAYVRDRIPGGFAELQDGTFEDRLKERFAKLAWSCATGPVMSPPYADWHAPVLDMQLHLDINGRDGLVAAVELASPWPQGLRDRRYQLGESWHPWPREHSYGSDEDVPREPRAEDVLRGDCYALSSVRLVFAVPLGRLPDAPGAYCRPGEVEETAREAVGVLAAEFSAVVAPVADALGRP
jgi:hypothetical protein